MPVVGKFPPLSGTTGDAGTVAREQVEGWRHSHGGLNVALRSDGTWVAIDVDEYGEKHGAAQLAALEAELGPLPPTWRSTARGAGNPSGQRFFRVRGGERFEGKPAPDIEVVQRHHRYSVVAPSIHPTTGQRYRWVSSAGELQPGGFTPLLNDCPDLPERWVARFRVERPAVRDSATATVPAEALLASFPVDRATCAPVRRLIEAVEGLAVTDHVGHDVALDRTYQAVRLGVEGHAGAATAVERVGELFLGYARRERPRDADAEWRRILRDAADEAQRRPVETPCTCALLLDHPAPLVPAATSPPRAAPAVVGKAEQRQRLGAAHKMFRRWLGEGYDLAAIDATLAAAAVERLTGDPLWLLLISGSGAAKTETAVSLAGSGAVIVSSISSAGALLSATSRGERSKAATGGLLRQIGSSGVLVIKDFTSVIEMHREARAEVMAALREVYDGKWVRSVGTDGGQQLPWDGRLVVVGACTTAWDSASAVLGAMGDRFALLRIDSTVDRRAASRQAIANVRHEVQMRAELAEAATAVLAGIDTSGPLEPTAHERDVLEAVADIVTLARTAVERDYRGDVIRAHAPEMGTRFGKQLAQVLRGGIAIGLKRRDALTLATRCARDSIPPERLGPLFDVAANVGASTHEVRQRLGKPRASVDRELQALQMLGVVTVEEEPTYYGGKEGTRWRYTLAEGLDEAAALLSSVPDSSAYAHKNTEKRVGALGRGQHTPADEPGTATAHRCRVCADLLVGDDRRALGLCAKSGDAHEAARLLATVTTA